MSERLETPVLILLTPEEIKAYAWNSHETNAKGITSINGNRTTEIAILFPNNTDIADVNFLRFQTNTATPSSFSYQEMGSTGM